ncbi:MAG TPA: glycerophosphodiester phosphodiesterase [Rhodocyclaceae bacterium]|nr:glycerophosphodiester phosphodiesterase [Rhodocyclaceae bacterium]
MTRTLADWPYPKVMAHRCGGALGPENTLVGLDMCVMAGCGGVEFDVMLSADGMPFVIHDETLERTTNGSGRVCDMNAASLMQLDAGAKHHRAFAGEPLPRFSEVIARCHVLNLAANIEIKPAEGFDVDTGEATARFAAIGWRDAKVPPLLSSFSEIALNAAAQVAPQLPRGVLVDRVPVDWEARCERLGAVSLHTNGRYLDGATARAIKAAGYRLAVYTENDPEQAHRMFAWGVDTIFTDRPDRVRADSP